MTKKIVLTKEQLIAALKATNNSTYKAADYLNISYTTFRKLAISFGIFKSKRNIFINTLNKDTIAQFIIATNNMAEAARLAKVSYLTFMRHAKKYGLWKPNDNPNKGRVMTNHRIKVEDILSGKHPHMIGFQVKAHLLRANHFVLECNICKITTWNNKPAPLQLDHINGDNTNHKEDNLRLLCANCHAQTDTFCGKNTKNHPQQPANTEC